MGHVIGLYLEQHQVLGERIDPVVGLVKGPAFRTVEEGFLRLVVDLEQRVNAGVAEGVPAEDQDPRQAVLVVEL